MATKATEVKEKLSHIIEGRDISQGTELSESALTFPNVLTLLRIVITPLMMGLLLADQLLYAFYVFTFAACSDFVDGWYAKRFKAQTRFGAFLDPLADKILMIALFVWFGMSGYAPDWFVVLVVSRDAFLLVGILITWLAFNRLWIAPLAIGKLTTLTQLLLGGLLFIENLFEPKLGFDIGLVSVCLMYGVVVLTLLSVFAYMGQWFLRINTEEATPNG